MNYTKLDEGEVIMMNNIVEELVTILEGLYEKNKQIVNIVRVLDDMGGTGLGFLHSHITELEYAIIKHLGGNKKNHSFFYELSEDNPFVHLEKGSISREEFLKQIKKGIELNLTPEAFIRGECSINDIK